MKKIHFISGLPRSGSTMLVAIMRQNPTIHVGMTLATLRVSRAVEAAVSRDSEVSMFLSEKQKLALHRGVFEAIYGNFDCTVFDKNHLWCARMPLIATLFPDAKVIACVRDLSWIMDSFERLYQANPLETAAMFRFRSDTTVYTRCSMMAGPEGIVGMSLDSLKEAYYGAFRDRVMLVDYNEMIAAPHVMLERIYRFIGEPSFKHDFDNFQYEAPAFDAAIGMTGLHTVRGPIRFKPRQTILPPDLFARFIPDSFWRGEQIREVA